MMRLLPSSDSYCSKIRIFTLRSEGEGDENALEREASGEVEEVVEEHP
jgi:hypothetical protein